MAKNEPKSGLKDVLTDWDVDPKSAKVLISIRVDGDVLAAYKELASREGRGYQTLMHQVLRSAIGSEATFGHGLASPRPQSKPRQRNRKPTPKSSSR